MAARTRASARAGPSAGRWSAPGFRDVLPSWRSLLVAALIVGLAAGAYVGARESSVFAVRELEIVGGSPALKRKLEQALQPELGRSLVAISGEDVEGRVEPIPEVLSVRIDRAFPNTLRVVVTPERPVLVLRRGPEGWVVSARGRVIRPVRNVQRSRLPRAWVPKETEIVVGRILAPAVGAAAAAALSPLAASGFPATVRTVRAGGSELTLVLHSGLELRFGDASDYRLKLAVARRILRLLGPEIAAGTYLDVNVPERPVVGSATLESQVEVEG
jgi:cell division protein FtsQ